MTNRRTFLVGLVLLTTVLPVCAAEPEPLPRVLILGASITIAYTPFVREMLKGEAIVIRANRNGKPENCQGTTYGVKNIDRWLMIDGGNWDVIHFNFGVDGDQRGIDSG